MPEATLGRQRSVLERTNPLLGAVVHQCLISCGQWSASLADVERWAQAQHGQGQAVVLSVNGGMPYAADLPFGGYKASGIGRQNGTAGFEQYLETKSLAWPLR